MFKRVLLPVSGKTHCERSGKALAKAKSICKGEIILLHVCEPVAQIVGGEAREELLRQHHEDGLAIMGPLIERLQTENIPFHARVEDGTPAETIVKIADEEKVDLIVMFTDGRDDLGDVFFGSITERVLRNTGIDLLAVRT